MNEVTQILNALERGEKQAANDLLPLVYDELRRLATLKLAQEQSGQTLQPTSLVHEVYLRMLGHEPSLPEYASRNHFFAAAAQAMRRILIEHARRRKAQKRGGNWRRQDITHLPAPELDEELLDLHEALLEFETLDPIKARLVEIKYFGGMSNDEAAAVLGISASTADRYWSYARAWLQTHIRGLE